jgi:PPOX class probable F420-dependent enzyme
LAYPKNPSPADVASARVARLATLNPSGLIDLVPVTFAFVDDSTIVTAVDHKPKRTTRLQRLANIRTNPHVTVLVDHYEGEWSRLWWVRLRGTAAVIEDPDDSLLRPLVKKYPQYVQVPPAGPAIVIAVGDAVGWSARG